MAVSAVNIPVTQILLWVFNSALDFEAVYANILAVSIAAVPAFFLYRSWVWSQQGRAHIRKEVAPFWATALAGLGVSTFSVWIFSIWWEGAVSVAFGNIVGFGLVWFGRFLIFEIYLFTHK